VVVPFRGGRAELRALRQRLSKLELGEGDSVLVVDNSPDATPVSDALTPGVPVVIATGRSTPGFARNQGAARGCGTWIVFIDADAEPALDLLDRYFEPLPDSCTGMLAGGVLDEQVPRTGPVAARYAYLRRIADQQGTLRFGKWGYPKTTNAAVRRAAFDAVGGFREELRAGEDADLTYRLRAAGWQIEGRAEARVVHRNRQTVAQFVAQRAVHGAGAAWLERTYPGSFPSRRRPGLVWWGIRTALRGLAAALWHHDRDRAVRALMEPLDDVAFEFGRSLANERAPR